MEPKLFTEEAAAYVGLSTTTWWSYGSTGRRPKPDGHENGRPFWFTRSLDDYRARRTGQGARVDLNNPPEEVICAIHAWMKSGDDRSPRERFDDFVTAFKVAEQRGTDDGYARFGVTITAWAVNSGQDQTTILALSRHPWLTATWREVGQLYFEIIPRLTADEDLHAAISDKEA